MDGIFATVKRVLDYSNDMNCKTNKLQQGWTEGKSKLIKSFGGRLIVESPTILTVDKPDEDKILEYRNYVDDVCFQTANEELRAFLIEQGWTAFYGNSVYEKWDRFGIRVPKGMKITRALKFFIKDKQELDQWQTAYSRLIQDVKVTGRMCLSVHPLDYLSISETTHSWRSCHSLDGEYRAGNLSYMQDTSTIVAYLKSEGEYKLPSFPEDVQWNAKKWRMLFYVNEDRDLAFSSKPYPFDNNVLVNTAYDMLQGIFNDTSWSESYIEMEPDEAAYYISDAPGTVQFNDCLSSASFEPRYKTAKGKSIEDCSQVEVGAPVWCLDCENEVIEFGADYTCVDCGDYLTCESCDCHMYADEAYYLDKQHLCPGCYDDAVIWCDGCGEAHNRENPEIVYDEIDETWYCPRCYDNLLLDRAVNWVDNTYDFVG